MSDSMKTLIIIVFPFILLICAIIYRNKINRSSRQVVIETKEIKPLNDTIYIRGLGEYQKSDLKNASKIIQKFFGFNCKIIEPVKTRQNMYLNDKKSLSDYETLYHLSSDYRTLYITDEPIFKDSIKLRGSTLTFTNNMIVQGDKSFMKSTIIHELGHLLGLEHCNDLTCVMAINNDEYDTKDYCVNCKKLITYPNI